MKLSRGNTSRERLPRLRSAEALLERTQPEVEFDPRRDVPDHLWEYIEENARDLSRPKMKSNVESFLNSLLELSIIDEKIRVLLASRNDLVQHRLNRLPIITKPEKEGVTPGFLEETADLLQLIPELGRTVRATEKPGPGGYKWYIDRQVDDLTDYLYKRNQPETEDNDPMNSLLSGLRGSLAVMRLFPADRAELKEELEKINIPNELLTEAQNQLAKGRVEMAVTILAHGRVLFPEQSDTYKELIYPYWNELKTRMKRIRSHFSGWTNTAFAATVLAAHTVEIDHEGKISIHLKSPEAPSSKPLPERYAA